jgi:hypothetical protein
MFMFIFINLLAVVVLIWMGKSKPATYLFALNFIISIGIFLKHVPIKVPL